MNFLVLSTQSSTSAEDSVSGTSMTSRTRRILRSGGTLLDVEARAQDSSSSENTESSEEVQALNQAVNLLQQKQAGRRIVQFITARTEARELRRQTTTPQNMSTQKVLINGIEVEVLKDANIIKKEDIKAESALKKGDRSSLDKDKWVSIKSKMEQGMKKEYTELSMSKIDLATLTNTYELVQQNKAVVQHLEEWDLTDVFTLVGTIKVNSTTGASEADTKSLLADWPTITVKEVAESNLWYNQHSSQKVCPWIRENMEISHKFILNSCDNDLRSQVTDKLATYETGERGGPLTFRILMGLLQVNSEHAIKHLIGCVKKIDVKNFDGENIIEVGAQIRGAHIRLQMVNFSNTTSSVPLTFADDVMDVLATTSTNTFNQAFDCERQRAAARLSNAALLNLSIDNILDAAIDLYNDAIQDDAWLGVDNKAKETAFHAAGGARIDTNQRNSTHQREITCFNCGGKHKVQECSLPLNQAKIDENACKTRAEWGRNRQGRGGRGHGGRGRGRGRGGRGGRGTPGRGGRGENPSGKFCPPAAYENNRRTIQIHGGQMVPHNWDANTSRWIPRL